MLKCEACGVIVRNPRQTCPLCDGPLIVCEGDQAEVRVSFPDYSDNTNERTRLPLAAKIVMFCSVIVAAVCLLVNWLVGGFMWSLLVVGGLITLWALAGIPLLTNMNINAMLVIHFIVLSAFLYLTDVLTGDFLWSVKYAIPGMYIAVVIAAVTLTIVFRAYWRDYLNWLAVAAVCGLIPILLFALNGLDLIWSGIAVGFTALSLIAGLLFFAWNQTHSEFRRRLNI